MLASRFEYDNKIEVGIDEAGRGCFWGPIMAGAVVLSPEDYWSSEFKEFVLEIRDSKKISPKKRVRIAEQIKSCVLSWSVGSVSAADIDEKGITWANQEAFRRAVAGLNVTPERLIIDGALELPENDIEQQVIVEADGKYIHVAAASILAKVEHDIWVEEFCRKNPEYEEKYSLLSSKGYGTLKHREGLIKNGSHEYHRKTFIYKYVSDEEKKHIDSITKKQTKSMTTFKKGLNFNKCLIQSL